MWLVQLRDRISNKGDDRMKAMLLDICDAAIDKWGSDNQDEMDYVRSAERREFEFRGERFNDSESEMIWIYEEV